MDVLCFVKSNDVCEYKADTYWYEDCISKEELEDEIKDLAPFYDDIFFDQRKNDWGQCSIYCKFYSVDGCQMEGDRINGIKTRKCC